MAAAFDRFVQAGYLAVSVDDIAGTAGVSRVTFYRHFRDKAHILRALFEFESGEAQPRFLAVAQYEYTDVKVVRNWIRTIFEADRAAKDILDVYGQATRLDRAFMKLGNDWLSQLVVALGEYIPAFRIVDPASPDTHRQWVEAWLLLYKLVDQSNHAALDTGVGSDPTVIEILADDFVAFVRRYSSRSADHDRPDASLATTTPKS